LSATERQHLIGVVENKQTKKEERGIGRGVGWGRGRGRGQLDEMS
jgi:hypothetical protein